MRVGNEIPVAADVIEDSEITVDIGKEIILPEKVNAVMNDGSRAEVPVHWQVPDDGLDSAAERTFTIHGEAGGLAAACTVRVVRFNYAQNPSFEENDLSMWRCEDKGQTAELYCEEKKTDSLTGSRHWHFYSAQAGTVRFTLEQDLALESGKYEYRISIMGGDADPQEVYSYVKADGEIIATSPAVITSYNNWDTPVIHFECAEGQAITCGIFVRCDGAGAWGKIDDMVVVTDQ